MYFQMVNSMSLVRLEFVNLPDHELFESLKGFRASATLAPVGVHPVNHVQVVAHAPSSAILVLHGVLDPIYGAGDPHTWTLHSGGIGLVFWIKPS